MIFRVFIITQCLFSESISEPYDQFESDLLIGNAYAAPNCRELAVESPSLAGFRPASWETFRKHSSSLRCRPLVTGRTFLGGWRIEILARFHNLIVATGAVAMKGLLVSQGNQLSADFKLDLRNFRQELRLRVGSSMTIATDSHFGCSWDLSRTAQPSESSSGPQATLFSEADV